jgi:hypothetical protein
MFDKRRVDGEPAFIDLQNLVDAAAGRIGFESESAISRALLQAKSAVDAPGVEFPARPVLGGEIRLGSSFDGGLGAQRRNLPRLSVSFGLSARLTASMESRWDGDVPQTLIALLRAAGQRVTTAEASRGRVRRNESTTVR